MARLPSNSYLINQVRDDIIVWEDGTERELVRWNVYDTSATAKAQREIHESEELSDEDKSFAHFWAGYFYAHAVRPELGRG